jgi:GT2 family glycosyltransferase
MNPAERATVPPTVSVIIPNWNGAHHLPTCLDSLRAQRWTDAEIIVVDNASEDESRAVLARYPEVAVMPQQKNLGFTGACNAGLRVARGEIQILLNNDTETDPHWLTALVDAFRRHPEVGMVASKMRLFDRRDVLHTAGDYVTPDGMAHNRGIWQRDEGQYNHEAYVFSACGGSAAYRRRMLEEIGLLDEAFFFSFEDVDLAWRAQLAGWRCLYTPDAVVYHKLKASGGGATASFYDGRNRIFTLIKNYPADLWAHHRPDVIQGQWTLIKTAAQSWRGREARATLRGVAAGLLRLPLMLPRRRSIQARRKAGLIYLERLMNPPYEIRTR